MSEVDKQVLDRLGRLEEMVTDLLYLNKQILGQDEVFSVNDAAEYLGVSPRTVRRRLDRGQYKNISPPKSKVLIKKSDLGACRSRGKLSALSLLG